MTEFAEENKIGDITHVLILC